MIDQTEEKELLLKVRDLHAVFIGINGQPGQFSQLSKAVDAQDKRIRNVERFQYMLTGMGVVFSFILYKFGAILGSIGGFIKLGLLYIR